MDELAFLGAWRLQQFERIAADGTRKPWGRGLRGLLVYAPGWMSVMIRREPEGDPQLVDVVAYAGPWRLDGERVVHQVETAAHAAWIGGVQVRRWRFEGEQLVLTADAERGGCFELRWGRA